jgi:hypothetical protein
MIAKTRASLAIRITVCLASLMFASLLPAAIAAGAEAPIAYQTESYAEYQQQLAGGQIAAVTINKRLASLRTTLKDGRYVLAKYGRHEEPKAVAALQAAHVPVTVLSDTEALKEVAAKPVHHKLRYIAAGVLIVVILIAGTVLYMRRSRQHAME